MATAPPQKQFDVFNDGTPGIWYEILPDISVYPQPWPVEIMGFAGGFKNGSALQANLLAAADDMSAAGIACLSVQARNDQKLIHGQTGPAFWPCQTDDYKRAVKAARLDSRFDPLRVGAVAASSGAASCHGCAAESAPSLCANATSWSAADRVKCYVSMSGAFQYDDRTAYTFLKPFVNNVNIYCVSKDLTVQNHCSPTYFMDAGCAPMYLCNGEFETMPPAQYNAMVAKAIALGITYHGLFVTGGTVHGFDNWGSAMRDGVIDWILAHL